MKRLVSIFILCAYLSSALGLDFNVHFCAGKFDSIAFVSAENKGCKCIGEDFFYKPGLNKKIKSCCKDVHVHCSFNTSFENESSSVIETANHAVLLRHFNGYLPLEKYPFVKSEVYSELDFIQLRKISIFLSNRVLRL